MHRTFSALQDRDPIYWCHIKLAHMLKKKLLKSDFTEACFWATRFFTPYGVTVTFWTVYVPFFWSKGKTCIEVKICQNTCNFAFSYLFIILHFMFSFCVTGGIVLFDFVI